MKKTGPLHLKNVLAGGVAALLIGGFFSAPVFAQQPPEPSLQTPISLTAQGMNVREALSRVAKDGGFKIEIAPDVMGKVMLSLQNVTVRDALTNLCRQANAKFVVNSGTILVSMKNESPERVGLPGQSLAPPPLSPKITVAFQNTDAREALRQVFRQTGASYSIDPMVQGTVSYKGSEVPSDAVLTSMLHQINATFRKEDGIYKVMTLAQDVERIRLDAANWSSEPPVVTQDEHFLYLVGSGRILKVRKSDLTVERDQAIPLQWGAKPTPPARGGF